LILQWKLLQLEKGADNRDAIRTQAVISTSFLSYST